MKRNRKRTKKMSVVATNSMRLGAVLLAFFVMVIINHLSSSSCAQLMKAKGLKEREIAKLEDSRMRESTRWEEMKTPEKIKTALLRHGLAMELPRPDQNVKMLPDGRPRPGQLSLARAKQRERDIASAGRSGVPAIVSYRRGRGR
ncbi:MAG: hypothetical protein J6T01_05990 [Kiritimatiellae bacterium]|nr:hypothetical protein [Kiritimatiellia bacterium]